MIIKSVLGSAAEPAEDQMATRRQVLIALGGGALCSPFRSFAQSQARLPRIGYLSFAPITDAPSPERAAFLDGLRELGYIDRKTITIEYQSGEMNVEMLPDAADELVDRKVDLIVAAGTVAAVAAKNATKSIPVVMMFSSEPVASGLVKSLAKPGGNVTGTLYRAVGARRQAARNA
jgi:putative ABC transport system substrate-binding protein